MVSGLKIHAECLGAFADVTLYYDYSDDGEQNISIHTMPLKLKDKSYRKMYCVCGSFDKQIQYIVLERGTKPCQSDKAR